MTDLKLIVGKAQGVIRRDRCMVCLGSIGRTEKTLPYAGGKAHKGCVAYQPKTR